MHSQISSHGTKREVSIYLSIYLSIYQHPFTDLWSYQKFFTMFICTRPVSVLFLCEEEPPPPRSTPQEAYKWPGSCIHCVNLGKQHIVSLPQRFAFLCLLSVQTHKGPLLEDQSSKGCIPISVKSKNDRASGSRFGLHFYLQVIMPLKEIHS